MKVQRFAIGLYVLSVACLPVGMQAETQYSQITTVDGRSYRNVTVLRAEPDGLVVEYQAEAPGLAMAKLKFRSLPEAVRTQFGYDAAQAADFESRQAQATAQWRTQAAAESPFQQYRALAELNRSLAGDAFVSYSISLDADGRPTLQGFAGNVLPYPRCFLWDSPWNSSLAPGANARPVRNGAGTNSARPTGGY